MLLDYLILMSVRENEAFDWYKKVIDYINENQEKGLEELKDLCDTNNYTSPYKAGIVAHNAKVIYDDIMKQLENA